MTRFTSAHLLHREIASSFASGARAMHFFEFFETSFVLFSFFCRARQRERQTERQRSRESGPTCKSPTPACDGTHRRRSELVGCICLCFSPHPPPLRQPWQPRLDPNLSFSSRPPRSYPVPNLCRPLNQNRGRDIVNLGRSPVSQSFSPLLRMHIFLEPFTERHTHADAVRKKIAIPCFLVHV